MTRHVAFVGPLPPPVHGFSVMCGLMLHRLKTRMPVAVFDRAPKVNKLGRTVLLQSIRPIQYLGFCLSRRDTILYLALSGGRGQVLDLMYVVISRIFFRQIFVHHHSFAYINASSVVNRLVFGLLSNAVHIVLSHGMGEALRKLYGFDASTVRVISNSAFYPPATLPPGKDPLTPIHVGFLSNITKEKGFIEFFAILSTLNARQIDFRAHIAGPLAPEARLQFEALLASSANVEYLGPIYGDEKERFFRLLDIFVFPTNYVNEAEPLVLLEALQAGAHVIACDRGAIPEMLSNGSGLVFPSESIVNSAADCIRAFTENRANLAHAQQLSFQQSRVIQESAATQLDCLLRRMTG